MDKKIIFILAVTISSFFISIFGYSFFRYLKIIQNNSCGRSGAPCVYQMVPPSLLELITNHSSTEMRPPCDLTATTTDCIMPPPPPSDSPTPSPSPMQSGKIDDHLFIDLTLRDVNFCGKIYKVKQVIIDGVDVVQRIAELATKGQFEYGKEVCRIANELANNRLLVLNEIGVSEVINNNTTLGPMIYQLNLVASLTSQGEFQHIGDFDINISTGDISIVRQEFDGYTNESFGTLK